MPDPFFDSLAAALAGQAAVTLSDAGKKALARVRELIRGKAEEDPETQRALEAAEDSAARQPEATALAERLDRHAAEDPEFDRRIRAEGRTVYRAITAGPDSVINEVSGNVEKVIQARDIHGDINL